MTYRGTIRNGVVELEQGTDLPDGTVVKVEPLETPSNAPPGTATIPPLFRMGGSAAKTGLADLATNIDHYLYGHPKVRDDGR